MKECYPRNIRISFKWESGVSNHINYSLLFVPIVKQKEHPELQLSLNIYLYFIKQYLTKFWKTYDVSDILGGCECREVSSGKEGDEGAVWSGTGKVARLGTPSPNPVSPPLLLPHQPFHTSFLDTTNIFCLDGTVKLWMRLQIVYDVKDKQTIRQKYTFCT